MPKGGGDTGSCSPKGCLIVHNINNIIVLSGDAILLLKMVENLWAVGAPLRARSARSVASGEGGLLPFPKNPTPAPGLQPGFSAHGSAPPPMKNLDMLLTVQYAATWLAPKTSTSPYVFPL